MLYDAIIESYTKQSKLLEERLQEIRQDKTIHRDDTYSTRVALLEQEILELKTAAEHLRERQYMYNDKN